MALQHRNDGQGLHIVHLKSNVMASGCVGGTVAVSGFSVLERHRAKYIVVYGRHCESTSIEGAWL